MPQRRRIFGLAAKMVFNLPKHMLRIYFICVCCECGFTLLGALRAFTHGPGKISDADMGEISSAGRIRAALLRFSSSRTRLAAASDLCMSSLSPPSLRSHLIICVFVLGFLWQQSLDLHKEHEITSKHTKEDNKSMVGVYVSQKTKAVKKIGVSSLFLCWWKWVFSSPSAAREYLWRSVLYALLIYFMAGRLCCCWAPPFLWARIHKRSQQN